MSDFIKMSNTVIKIPDNIFPFMNLPCELRQKIYRLIALKSDGYIGQADRGGVKCAMGTAQANFRAAISANFSDDLHAPFGCLHPIHEKQQILKDFRDYRCINVALACRQMYNEITEVFFEGNGFELRDAYDLMQFVLLIGTPCMSLIRKLRLYHYIDLQTEDLQAIFEDPGVGDRTFCDLLATNYLDDDQPGSAIVQVLKYLKSCNNLKDFELAYRLEVPGDYFSIIRATSDYYNAAEGTNANYLPNYKHNWLGETMQWSFHTKNVLEKLRQDNGERTNEIFNVEATCFSTNELAEEIATALGRRKMFFGYYAQAMSAACLNHAETCIESTAHGQNRIMEAPHF